MTEDDENTGPLGPPPAVAAGASTRPACCGATIVAYCGPRPCPASSCCCRWCPSVKESKSTKCIYTFVLVSAAAALAALMLPGLQRQLQAAFRDFHATCTDLKIVGDNCLKLTGYMAAYKVSFALSFFFLAMAGLTLAMGRARPCLHNGFWAFKVVLILGLLVATFVIPISHLSQLHTAWIYTCLVGNLLFILLQMACLVDFSNKLCKTFHRMAGLRRSWRLLEALAAFVVISLWLTMAIALFLIHGQQRFCLTKQFILIFNTGFCICLVLAALTPCARGPPHGQTAHAHTLQTVYASRLLQSGLVIVYMTYWVWTAMQSSPETPGIVELSFLLDEEDLVCIVPHNQYVSESLSLTALFMMLFTVCYINSDWMKAKLVPPKPAKTKTKTGSQKKDAEMKAKKKRFLHQLPKAAVRWCPRRDRATTTATSGTVPANGSVGEPSDVSRPQTACLCLNENDSFVGMPHPKHIIHEPIQELPLPPLLEPTRAIRSYNYSGFHLVLALALMFSTTQVTRWFSPSDLTVTTHLDTKQHFDRSWRGVVTKLGAAWICGLGYLLYLLLPEACLRQKWCAHNNSNRAGGSSSSCAEDGESLGNHLDDADEDCMTNLQEQSITLSHM